MGRPLKIAVAGGGTGGHTQPAVATLSALRSLAAFDAIWIGSGEGVERDVALQEGIPFYAVPAGKLRRYLSLQTVTDSARIPVGVAGSLRVLRRYRPDVVFATGGFVSVPSVVAARLLKLPSLTHEQTATVGLANRINTRFCSEIALAYESSRNQIATHSCQVVVTGNPIRESLFCGDARRAHELFELDPAMPVTYVTGGARGAQALNEAVRQGLNELTKFTQVVHQTGPASANGDYPRLLAAQAELPLEQRRRYHVREQIGSELADLYAATTVVVSRAGAGTVAEIATLGLPSILIPLPGAGSDEQTKNAEVLARDEAAVLLPQSELTPESLQGEISRLIYDDEARETIAARALRHGHRDAASKLAREILHVAGYSSRNGASLSPASPPAP
ncbi:MAG TPA: undecaprenyldiphospho-muramoylpentapeptide beta-N-acetylglucosaminyltransferase [Thermomicrobiaceae bacterium]|nr:undecaprenyldiphospho-muramoylpentapeptide beta-N-acetylglucosaminyltransferase [Thermomicrobiaceae bacterium]